MLVLKTLETFLIQGFGGFSFLLAAPSRRRRLEFGIRQINCGFLQTIRLFRKQPQRFRK